MLDYSHFFNAKHKDIGCWIGELINHGREGARTKDGVFELADKMLGRSYQQHCSSTHRLIFAADIIKHVRIVQKTLKNAGECLFS